MHRLLQRQLLRHLGDTSPADPRLAKLVEAVDVAYQEFDNDRLLLERSLELTSHELVSRNQELRRDVERRAEVAELLEDVLESTGEGLLVVDGTGRVLHMNEPFRAMWRIEPEAAAKIRNEDDLGFLLPQLIDPAAEVERIKRGLATAQTVEDSILTFRDGRIFERSCRPLLGHGGGRIWRFRDVTVQRRLEAELVQSQKMEAIGQLAGGIAHDFNNILMAITGFGRMLEEDLAGSPLRDDVAEILAAAERATTLTCRLLAFSRKQMRAPVVLAPAQILAEMTDMLQRLIGTHIQLRTSVAPDAGRVRMDPGQLEQVIMNLVVNARDAMPEGGELRIGVDGVVVEGGKGRTPGAHVRIQVRDTGSGMDASTLARIFEPFFTTKEAGKGTGLGLSTVYGIVDQSGGWVEVDSEPGSGSTFRLFVPVAAAPTAAEPKVERLRDGRGKVLLVEDDGAVRRVAKRILDARGYDVIDAADGVEALELSEQHLDTLALLVTDVVMPSLNGPEVARRLRERRRDLPVLFISGFADSVITDAITRSGDRLLRKPFSADDLADEVRSILRA